MPSARLTRSRAHSPSLERRGGGGGGGTRSRGAARLTEERQASSPARPAPVGRAPQSPASSTSSSARMRTRKDALLARDRAGPGGGSSGSNSSSTTSSSTRRHGRRRNEEEEGEEQVLQRGGTALNIPSADVPQQQPKGGSRPPRAGREEDQNEAKLARREDEEEDHQATPFQRLLKTSSSLVSSAVKGVMGLMSPREEHARRTGSGEMSRDLVASLGDDGASPSTRAAVMNGMRPKTPATVSTAWAQRRNIAYAGNVDDDGAVELPPSWTDGAAEEGEYEGQPVDSITVSELKKILRLKGLSYKGKKSELADRLKEWLRFEQQSQQQLGASRPPPVTRSRSPAAAPAPSSPAGQAVTSTAEAREQASQVRHGLLRSGHLERDQVVIGHAYVPPVAATAKVTDDDHNYHGNSTSRSSSSSGQRQSPVHRPAWMREEGGASLPRPLVPIVKPAVTRGALPLSEGGRTTVLPAPRGGGGVEESKSCGSGGTIAASKGSGDDCGQRGVEEVYGVVNTFLNKKGGKARTWGQRGGSPVPLPSSAGFVAYGAEGGVGGRDGGGGPRYKRPSIASNMTPFSAAAAVASTLQDEMPDLNFMSGGSGGDGGGRREPLSNSLAMLHRSQEVQAHVSSSSSSLGGRISNSHSVRFAQEEEEQKGGEDSRAAPSRFRTTPYVDRSRPLYANGRVGGSVSGNSITATSLSSSGRKRGSMLESADATRSVRQRQAPRAPSRWSDLVTRRILNSMQEQMRTPMQDAKSQFVPTPLRSRALPAREVGEVSPPRQGMSAVEEQHNNRYQEQQQQQWSSRDGAGPVQPSRLAGVGRDKRRRQDKDQDDEEDEEEKQEGGGGGEPGVFKLPHHSLLPEPRPVFGVEAAEIAAVAAPETTGPAAGMEENVDFAFTAPQVMLLDEDEEREVEAAVAQHHEEFIFTPPVKRRLRPRRAGGVEQQQIHQIQQQQKQHQSLLRPPATSVPPPASTKKDADRVAMPPPQPRQLSPARSPAPPADTKPSSGGGGDGWGDLRARLQKPGSWKCDGCLSTNIDAALLKCPSCESPKPGSTSAPSSVSPAPSSATAFVASPAPAAALTKTSMPTFGMGTITSQGFSFGGGGSGVIVGGGATAEPKTTEDAGGKEREIGDKAKAKIGAGPTFEGEKGGGPGERGFNTSENETRSDGFSFGGAPMLNEKKQQEKQKEIEGGEGSKETNTDQAAPAPAISPFVFGSSTSNVAAGKEKEAAAPAPQLPSFTFGGLPSSSTADADSSANGGIKDTAKTTSTTPAPSTPSFTFGGTGTAGGAATFTAPSFGTFGAPAAQGAPVSSSLFSTASSSSSSESVPVAFPPVSLAASKPSSAGSTSGSLFANVPSTLPPLSGTTAVADQPAGVGGSATSASTTSGGLKSTPPLPAFPSSVPASSSGSSIGTGGGLPPFTFGAAPAPTATAPGGLSSFSFSGGGTTATPGLKPSGSGGGLGSVPFPEGGSMDMSASPRLSPSPTPAASAPAFSSAPPSFQFGSHVGAAKPPLFGATSTPAAPAGGFGAGVGIGVGGMGAAQPSGLTSTAPTFGAASPAPMFGAPATSNPAVGFGQPTTAPAGGMFDGPPRAPGGMAGGFGAPSGAPAFGGFGAPAGGVGGMGGFGGALPAPGGDAFSLGASSSQQQPGGRKIIKARRPVRK